ncbi:hypothetical protein [Polycladidibacter hongkongensis]|uniref:hypothetical protein n=1 Tax=Polycladidibacter hongkongensis TaxID=1647556 RepID=UPI00083501C5|nr:hypothetical protein [Pseudovibrio hongkongensis]
MLRVAAKALLFSSALALALPLASVPVSSPVQAQVSPAGNPDLMMLELQIMQDEIVMGNRDAYRLLQPSLIVIGRRFLRLDHSVWKDRRNAYAAVAFMLSGGSGSVFQALAQQEVHFNVDANLFAGALAYSQGNRTAAKNLLLKVNAKDLPTAIAGQVALAQAILLSRDEPVESIEYFDLARLLMPGTLVEESALRREAPIVAAAGDHEKYERLSRRYLFQYQKSVFASQFRDQLARTISTQDYLSGEKDWEQVMQLLSDFDVESRKIVLVKLARAAVVAGNTEFAMLAGDAFLELPDKALDQLNAISLYRGAARAAGEDWRGGLDEILGVKEKYIAPEDRVLLRAAITKANMIRNWPSPSSKPASEYIAYVPASGLQELLLEPQTFVKFEASLADADSALEESEF